MRTEDMAKLLTSLEVAAEVVEAIDNPELQVRRGWDLRRWTYDCIPWGIRLFHYDEQMTVTAALLAIALHEEQRAALPHAYVHSAWPTTILMLGYPTVTAASHSHVCHGAFEVSIENAPFSPKEEQCPQNESLSSAVGE